MEWERCIVLPAPIAASFWNCRVPNLPSLAIYFCLPCSVCSVCVSCGMGRLHPTKCACCHQGGWRQVWLKCRLLGPSIAYQQTGLVAHPIAQGMGFRAPVLHAPPPPHLEKLTGWPPKPCGSTCRRMPPRIVQPIFTHCNNHFWACQHIGKGNQTAHKLSWAYGLYLFLPSKWERTRACQEGHRNGRPKELPSKARILTFLIYFRGYTKNKEHCAGSHLVSTLNPMLVWACSSSNLKPWGVPRCSPRH